MGISVSAAGLLDRARFLHDQPPTSSAERCRVLDSWDEHRRMLRTSGEESNRRGRGRPSERWAAAFGSCAMLGDHRHVQGLGDLASSVRLSLADDDQTQRDRDRSRLSRG